MYELRFLQYCIAANFLLSVAYTNYYDNSTIVQKDTSILKVFIAMYSAHGVFSCESFCKA